MGPCELSSEPAGSSPRMFVVDRTEDLVDNSLSESFIEHGMEPLSSLDVSPPITDRGGGDSVVQLVAQHHCCLDLGDGLSALGFEDKQMTNACPVPAHSANNTEASMEMADLKCPDGPGELACDTLGEELHELVVVSLSGLDISSQTPGGAKDKALISSSKEGFCNLDHSSGTLEARDETARDFCLEPNYIVTKCEPINESHDVKCGCSDNNSESGNALTIKGMLNKVSLDGALCKNEINSFISDLTVDCQVPSGIHLVADSPSGSAAQYTYAGCDNHIDRSLMEAVCVGNMDNELSKVEVMTDTLNGCVVIPGFTHEVESNNLAGSTGFGNDGTDGNMCELKCPDTCSLPLRRSSRFRKSVQQVQRGKNSTSCMKNPSKGSIHRTIDLLSEATRKKRSCLSRSSGLSGWGMSGNLSKYFPWSNGVAGNPVMDQRLRKKKAGQKSRKKNMIKLVENLKLSEEKQPVPCRPIRLKVTFGKKGEANKVDGTPPVMIDALPGVQSGSFCKPLNFCSFFKSSGRNVIDNSVSKEMPSLMQCSNSTSNVQFIGSDVEINSLLDKSTCVDSSQLDFEKRGSSCADKFLDPGTSPDSEVIDQVLESTTGQRDLTSLHNLVNKDPLDNAWPGSGNFSASAKMSKNRRKKEDKFCQSGNPGLECQNSADGVKVCKKGGLLEKFSNDFCSIDKINAFNENPPSNTSGTELVLTDLLPVTEEGPHRTTTSPIDAAGINTYSRIIIGTQSVSRKICKLPTPGNTQKLRNSKGSRTKGKPRNKSKKNVEIGNQKEPSCQQNGKKKVTNKYKVRETGILSEAYKINGQLATGNLEVDLRKNESSYEVPIENASCVDLIPTGVREQPLAPRVAWVCCDDCLKWRCIPAELADTIEETNRRWTCKDNQVQAFSDCSIPQEKSNAEINAELQISDEEDGRDGHVGSKGSVHRQLVALQPATWMLIKSNLFLHRSRKDQTMDEIMVCHCKRPVEGRLGCGSHCLNRMLNIECVQGTCPCGDLCSNQQFQKRQYAKLSWFRCGKKGYGLQVLEDISEGQFLIEYVGEVLDLKTYEARQKDYAAKGHKHFYFMTLNGNEVIDASAKGNLGRFVNHSCDPNCRTEKWVVNGEICVGLFALRNIKEGEELTFDYNYVRVFGAAAKKCHCGSHKCRGYIGGDPHNAEIIVQGDSDEEFPEPVVINENGEIDHSLEDIMVKSSSQNVERAVNGINLNEENLEVIVEVAEKMNKVESSVEYVEPLHTVPGKDVIDQVHESSDCSTGLQPENKRAEPISAVQKHTLRVEPTMSSPTSSSKSDVLLGGHTMQKSFSGSVDSSDRVSEVEIEREPPHVRPCPRMKVSRPSVSVKNRKSICSSANIGKGLSTTQRPKVLSSKPKRLLETSSNGHFEAVEEKLNELLDADSGICKKKDASKGYLKLLLLTAASGDTGNGGAIQSNRDLSMILDAMLKTKSRGVLLDIINKNGLQMLHNMMKLYRSDFKKIPILRKILKVLEFLAEKEILTVERINGDSLHPGVESLRESILSFTEHNDNQVHQIARNFRDRWIRYPRKFVRLDKSDRRREFRRGSNSCRYYGTFHHWREQGATIEHATCSDQSGPLNYSADGRIQEASSSQFADGQSIVSRPRRRKSRWDQPASPKKIRTSPKVETNGGQTPAMEITEEGDHSGAPNFSNHRDKGTDKDTMHRSDDDAPPGFSCPYDDSPPGFSSLMCPSTSVGHIQERFNPNLPVAYGIPFPIVQKFGTLRSGTVDSWAVAPAMPFEPFPPLPPCPRDKRLMGDQEEARQGYQTHVSDQGIPCASGASENDVATNQNMWHNGRGVRNIPGKWYYRHKRNNQKLRRPWVRSLEGWGFNGNFPPHPRNGAYDTNMVANEQNGQHVADVNHSVEFTGSSC